MKKWIAFACLMCSMSVAACPVTEHLDNANCTPEMTAEGTILAAYVYESPGDVYFGRFRYLGESVWELDVVGHYEDLAGSEIPFLFTDPVMWCPQQNLLFFSGVLTPAGYVKNVTLVRESPTLPARFRLLRVDGMPFSACEDPS